MESGPGATLVSCRHPRGLPKVSLQKYKPFLAISYGFMPFHTMMSLNLSALDLLLRNSNHPRIQQEYSLMRHNQELLLLCLILCVYLETTNQVCVCVT